MSNVSDYQEILNQAEAIPSEEIKSPHMPMKTFLLQAETYYFKAAENKEGFLQKGLPQFIFENMLQFIGAASHAESIWRDDVNAKEEAEKKWDELSPEGYDLKAELLNAYRYLYRKQPDKMVRIATIADGYGQDDLIQDLNDLGVMGLNDPEPLKVGGITEERTSRSCELSDILREVLSKANCVKGDDNEKRVMRDRMYTLVKNAVDEIKLCAKFVYWRQPDKLNDFTSQYHKN